MPVRQSSLRGRLRLPEIPVWGNADGVQANLRPPIGSHGDEAPNMAGVQQC